jgi:hypothetical protein
VQNACYFWIASKSMTAQDISRELGMDPDGVSVMGSRGFLTGAPLPAEHSWRVTSDRSARVEEQASAVLRRMAPVSAAVRRLVDRGEVEAGLMMVRHFDDPDGHADAVSWWLTMDQVQQLAAMGAGIQSDEYGP